MSRVRYDVAYTLLYEESKHQILMVRNRNGYWTLPGGGREAGETLAECAIREAREESGYEVTVGDLLAVNERLTDTTHDLFFTFHGAIVSAPDVMAGDENILEVRWVDVGEAERLMPFHPEGISNLMKNRAAYRLQR